MNLNEIELKFWEARLKKEPLNEKILSIIEELKKEILEITD